MFHRFRAPFGWLRRALRERENYILHRDKAGGVYASIVAADPSRALTAAQEREIQAYAVETLGSRNFVPWLRVMTAYTGAFQEGWIPQNYLTRIVLPGLHGSLHGVSVKKTLSRRILMADEFPDRVARVAGCWTDRAGRRVSAADSAEIAFDGCDRVFLKRDDSPGRGRDVFHLSRDDFDAAVASDPTDFIVQRPVRRDPFFTDGLGEGAISVLRVNTVKAPGHPAYCPESNLRVAPVGRALVAPAEEVKISVADDTGTLMEYGRTPKWLRVDAHPDTGVRFAGQTVPHYAKTVSRLCQIHDGVPHFAMIGWDVVATPDGTPEIIEWNEQFPELNTPQCHKGPFLAPLGWHRPEFRAMLPRH